MPKRIKQQKRDGRGEAVYAVDLCHCGCGQTDWFDVRHKQRFIKGHGGVALLERRKAALCFAIEVKLIARGFGVVTAARTAALALATDWKRARDEMQAWGWDYLTMTWTREQRA